VAEIDELFAFQRLTIHLAVRRLRQGNAFAFAICWLATIALGGELFIGIS
jgi:hypothetical protein